MTNQPRTIKRLGTLALAFSLAAGLGLLAGCGGSSGSSGGPGSTPARAFGEIESLGSIVVNGVKFEVENAVIIGPDDNMGPDDLTPGMVVVVKDEGEINANGDVVATEVVFEDNVRGPLTFPGTLPSADDKVVVAEVMGQTVVFEDNITKFDLATGMPLGDDVGKVFQVSGFQDDSGKIYATFARELDDGGVLEVTGTVSNHDPDAQTFKINDLNVRYTGVTPRDVPATGLADGMLVQVKGTDFDQGTSTLTAADIEGKERRLGDEMPKVHVEGMIADLTATTFTLNGQRVNYSNATYRAGVKDDLAPGIKVEAEGQLVNSVLLAARVTFKPSVRIEAAVDTVDVAAGTLTFVGLPGVAVLFHRELTRDFVEPVAIAAGTPVKVRARIGAADLVATRVDDVDFGGQTSETIIRGPVTAVAGAVVTILGTVHVDTAGTANDNFKDHGTSLGPNGRNVFFSRLQVGEIVKARVRDGIWDEIEFQD